MLAVEHPRWQPLPACITPMPVAVRPNTTEDPTIGTVEEQSDVGAFVILTPTPQERVKFRNQLLRFQRQPTLGAMPYPIHETTDNDGSTFPWGRHIALPVGPDYESCFRADEASSSRA